MKFTKLLAINTYSFKELSLDEDQLSSGGITCISGRNGSGKSTILKLLYYAIYGKELNGETLEEITKRGCDGHFVQVDFKDNGINYSIKRYRDFNFKNHERLISKGIESTSKKQKGLRFYVNDKLYIGDTDKSTQDIIVNKIGISSSLFLSSALTSQGSKNRLLMAPDTEKKKILSEFFDLDSFAEASKLVKVDLEVKTNQQLELTTRLSSLNNEMLNLKSESNASTLRSNKWKADLSEKIQSIKSNILTIKSNIDSIDQDIKKSNLSQELLIEEENKLNAIDTELDALVSVNNQDSESNLSELLGFKSVLDQGKAELESMNNELTKRTQSVETEIKLTKMNIETLKTRDGQVVSENHLQSKVAAISSRIGELSGKDVGFLNGDLTDFKSAHIEIKNMFPLTNTPAELKKLEKALLDIDAKIAFIRDNEIPSLEKEVSEIKHSESCPTCKRDWDVSLPVLKNRLLELDAEIKSKQELIGRGLAKRDEVSKKIDTYKSVDELIPLLKTLEQITSCNQKLENLQNELKKVTTPMAILDYPHKAKDALLTLKKLPPYGKSSHETTPEAPLADHEITQYHPTTPPFTPTQALNIVSQALSSLITPITQIQEQQAQKTKQIQEKIKTLKQIKDDLKANILKMKSDMNNQNQLLLKKSTQSGELKTLESKLSNLENEVDPNLSAVQLITQKLEKCQSSLVRAKESLSALNSEIEVLKFWEHGFGTKGIQSYIMDSILVNLNNKVKRYLDHLFDGLVVLSFSPEDEESKDGKITTNITVNGEKTPFFMMSGGEQRRVELAVDLALTEIAEEMLPTKLEFKMLDEPFYGMDTEGQLRALVLFKEMASSKNGFFVINHDKSFIQMCDRNISVKKENEDSYIAA